MGYNIINLINNISTKAKIITTSQEWTSCTTLEIGDTLKWVEPLWAAPNKPRGKRDKIGEQEIIAKLTAKTDVLEFTVKNVEKISSGDAPLHVQAGDIIKRKLSSIEKGNCQKLINKTSNEISQ